MAVLDYTAYRYTASTGVTTLTDFQHWSLVTGRNWATDPYSPSTLTIQCRGTAQCEIGDTVGVGKTGDSTFVLYAGGYVKDVKTYYGIKTSMDYTVYTVEGALSRWGRKQINAQAYSQNLSMTAITTMRSAQSVSTEVNKSGSGLSTIGALTYTGNGLDWFNQVMLTEMGHCFDYAYRVFSPSALIQPAISIIQRNYDTTADRTFADDSTAAGIRFDDIEFTSAAESYYTSADIQPEGLATQTVGSGSYNITQASYDYNTSQALSHAQYLVSQYNSKTTRPLSITATYANQDTATRKTEFEYLLQATYNSGSLIKIIFRGSTYYAVIEGKTVDADQENTRVSFTLSAFDNNNYLVLNNAVFGTLGTSVTYPGNKLGF